MEITKKNSNKTHHLVPQLDESRLPFLWSFPLAWVTAGHWLTILMVKLCKMVSRRKPPIWMCQRACGQPQPLGQTPVHWPRQLASNPPSSTMVHQAPPSRLLSLSAQQALSLSPRDSGGGSRLINNTLTVGDVPQNNYFHHKKINEGSKLGSFSSFSTSPASTLLGFELWACARIATLVNIQWTDSDSVCLPLKSVHLLFAMSIVLRTNTRNSVGASTTGAKSFNGTHCPLRLNWCGPVEGTVDFIAVKNGPDANTWTTTLKNMHAHNQGWNLEPAEEQVGFDW